MASLFTKINVFTKSVNVWGVIANYCKMLNVHVTLIYISSRQSNATKLNSFLFIEKRAA